MQLTEQHIVKSNEWRHWCVKAKDLYNQSLYYWRQSVFGEIDNFSEYELLGLYREFKDENFIKLPSHCGQEVLKGLFKNIKSWQRAKKEYAVNPHKFTEKPRMPKYKKELYILGFNNMQVVLKNGYIHFPKMIGISPIKTKIPDGTKLGACRVVPKSNHFVVEFVYNVDDIEQNNCNGNYLGVDLGLNNFATCTSNNGKSFIVSGRPIKSINQFYNKRKSKLQKSLPLHPKTTTTTNGYRLQVKTSKAISKLGLNRYNKIKNYIHHTSKLIINKCKEYNINTIIIGKNDQWKCNINLGKRTNQNFVLIPYQKLIEALIYKSKLSGLIIKVTEESYTSKCSALDLEPIQKHEKYVGKRIKRGLFRTLNGTKINADCNGSLNIIRKVVGDFKMDDSIVSAVIAPKKLLPFKTVKV